MPEGRPVANMGGATNGSETAYSVLCDVNFFFCFLKENRFSIIKNKFDSFGEGARGAGGELPLPQTPFCFSWVNLIYLTDASIMWYSVNVFNY